MPRKVSDASGEILIASARALAGVDGLRPSLQRLLEVLAGPLGIASAAIVTVAEPPGGLEIAASFGLGEAAEAGLAAAIRNPEHPIARTVSSAVATFDVRPMAPGGPALRSHLPLIVTRGGSDRVLGVLALAHDRPIDAVTRPLLQASADLAAVAIELHL
jgi:GAF domain-containing protein